LGQEIDLMRNYPRTKRDIKQRGAEKTREDRELARKFEKDFFDGDRRNGYGGFSYNSRFWQPVVPDFKKQYNLTKDSKVLDVGCAKGFMMHDFSEMIPGIEVQGIDVSKYAIENCMPSVKDFVQVADARELPFEDNSFDLVISVTTVHNFDREECIQALQEIERVSKKNAFITVDAYRNDLEKEAMHAWNLTAKTILHVDEWKKLFEEAGYSSDYFWFMP
jgi:ubiquinone/menaquinone biosynthesis C-methylase UbiE